MSHCQTRPQKCPFLPVSLLPLMAELSGQRFLILQQYPGSGSHPRIHCQRNRRSWAVLRVAAYVRRRADPTRSRPDRDRRCSVARSAASRTPGPPARRRGPAMPCTGRVLATSCPANVAHLPRFERRVRRDRPHRGGDASDVPRVLAGAHLNDDLRFQVALLPPVFY